LKSLAISPPSLRDEDAARAASIVEVGLVELDAVVCEEPLELFAVADLAVVLFLVLGLPQNLWVEKAL
jgi:hypothetical protein